MKQRGGLIFYLHLAVIPYLWLAILGTYFYFLNWCQLKIGGVIYVVVNKIIVLPEILSALETSVLLDFCESVEMRLSGTLLTEIL
jgi:hypothetical protein